MSKPEPSGNSGWLISSLPFLLLAAVIRFWDLANINLMNDELSAWARLGFSDFGSLMEFGVQTDVHPGLTQIFLWFWTGAFGDATWVLKLPFIFMSLGAILILYRLTFVAFGKNTADLVGALLAASQITVVFSILARPYAPGFIISAALVWVWYQLVFLGHRNFWKYVWFAVLISLSVYNNYFNGLFAIVVWTTGLLYWTNINWKFYFGAAILSFLLFLPHLNITLVQIGYKGIGSWLGPPDNSFPMEWLWSLFNYSIPAMILAAILFIWSSGKRFRTGMKKRDGLAMVFIFWFVLIFAVGFSYSIFVEPVLHHGALFFATPFLILGLAQLIAPENLAGRITPWMIAGLLIFSLVNTRNHYEVMRNQPFALITSHLQAIDQESDNAFSIIDQEAKYLGYYSDVDQLGFPVVNNSISQKSPAELIEKMVETNADVFYTDGSYPALVLAAHEIYPNHERFDGFTFTGYTFRKTGKSVTTGQIISREENDSETDAEFINLMEVDLGNGEISFGDEFGAVVRFAEKPDKPVHIVMVISRNGENIHWASALASENGFQLDDLFVHPAHILLWNSFRNNASMQNGELKMYIWNPDKTTLKINNWEVTHSPGNPDLYNFLNRRP